MDTVEEWRDIPGMPGYRASSTGRIGRMFMRRGIRGKPGKMFEKWFAAPKPMYLGANNRNHYWSVQIQGRHYYVHRLVCAAFHGPSPSSVHQAAHLNGNKADNRPENVTWATGVENSHHKRGHGRHIEGSRHVAAKLNEALVAEMKRAFAAGERIHLVAKRFGVKYMRAYKIARGMAWKHVA
jgi:hypothetical protein